MAIFLGTYSLEVFEGSSENSSALQVKSSGPSLRTLAFRTLRRLESCVRNETTQRMMRVTSLHDRGSEIWGEMDYGDYGYTGTGMSSETFQQTFRRTRRDAMMLPYYFRLHLPNDEHTGILIVQRNGVQTPYQELRRELVQDFRDAHQGHLLKFGRLVPPEVLRVLQEGEVRTFKVVTRKPTGDLADRFARGYRAEVGTMETTFKAKRGGVLMDVDQRWLRDLRGGRLSLVQMFPEAEYAQIGVNYNGRTRQFVIGREDEAAPYLEVGSDVEVGNNGHPVFESFNDYCVGVQNELRARLGVME